MWRPLRHSTREKHPFSTVFFFFLDFTLSFMIVRSVSVSYVVKAGSENCPILANVR